MVAGEFAAIDRLAAQLGAGHTPPAGETWIGDDAAAVVVPDGRWLLLAADAVVAGVHADLTLTTLADLGWKAMVANLSDLAAMGGTPAHALVTVAGPPDTDLQELYRGISRAAVEYGCPVVGGDLSGARDLVVTVAVTGSVEGDPILRRGAVPGDAIWVTGPLGAAAAGLRLLRQHGPGLTGPAVEAHARPRPRLAEGRAARRAGATAMIDVSDGLAADLGHLADRSGVGFRLDRVPVADQATLEEALGGGEDYQLVFTAPPQADVEAAFVGLAAPTQIGVCLTDSRDRFFNEQPLPPAGWQHPW